MSLTKAPINSTASQLIISAPPKSIEPNKVYNAKIVDGLTFKEIKLKKTGESRLIASVKVAIDDHKPFLASLLSEDFNEFANTKNLNDTVSVFIKFDGQYTNAEI